MILYFSATGNCRHVAQTIASALADDMCSLQDLAEYLDTYLQSFGLAES